jgi:hypothetical protein
MLLLNTGGAGGGGGGGGGGNPTKPSESDWLNVSKNKDLIRNFSFFSTNHV